MANLLLVAFEMAGEKDGSIYNNIGRIIGAIELVGRLVPTFSDSRAYFLYTEASCQDVLNLITPLRHEDDRILVVAVRDHARYHLDDEAGALLTEIHPLGTQETAP